MLNEDPIEDLWTNEQCADAMKSPSTRPLFANLIHEYINPDATNPDIIVCMLSVEKVQRNCTFRINVTSLAETLLRP